MEKLEGKKVIAVLLIQKIVQLFLIMVLGYILVKSRILKADDSVILSKIVIYLLMPCTVINAFQVDFTPEVREGFVFGFLIAIVLMTVMTLL